MKKKPYDVYSPEIYPRLLFVSTNIEDLDKYFIFLDVYGNNDGSEYNKLLQEIDKYDGGMVTCKVIRKSDNKYGVIVIAVTSTEDITPDMIPHEAVHVADYFCEQLGLYTQDFKGGNEWKLEVENNKPLYSSFSKEMKRLYNKVDELINEGVITYEDFTNDVIDSITTTIVDNGKNNAEPSRADQVNAMCDMLFKKYEEYKKVEHTGGDREVLVDNIELSDETQLRESERANETC